jgi:uncharacterized membrane protein
MEVAAMSGLPLHPAIVHFPLGVAAVVPLVALVTTVLLWRRAATPVLWVLVTCLQGVVVVSGFIAMRAGHHEEHRVERYVPEAAIEAHEEAGDRFVYAAGGLLVVMLLGLAVRDERARRAIAAVSTVTAFAVAALGLYAGRKGGELVYVHGAASAYTSGAAPLPHDDD